MMVTLECHRCGSSFCVVPSKAMHRYCSKHCARTRHGQGQRRTPEYECWRGMRKRCRDPNSKGFLHYGGRGITVCERWRLFENFFADMGPRPGEGYSIDRIDNDGNYEPGNCRWALPKEQANNRRCTRRLTFHGLTLTTSEWAARLHIRRNTLQSRLRYGWSAERALTEPVAVGPRRSPPAKSGIGVEVDRG